MRRTHHSKVTSPSRALDPGYALGYAVRFAGVIQGMEGRIQVLASLAPFTQLVGSNIRVIHEQVKHSSWMTEENLAPDTKEPNW